MIARASDAAATPSPGGPGPSLRRAVGLIAAGLFVTGFGWPGLIARLPLSLYLKNRLQLPAEQVALFWALGTIAWYGKPVIGLVCDAYPLFGTRRRGYLLAGAVACSLAWLAFAVVPARYASLLGVLVALNLAIVIVSTTVGGLLVETGQQHAATGRLSALREGLIGAMSLVAGPIGGWLAGQALGWTAATGALIWLAFIPIAAFAAREPRALDAPDARRVWAAAAEHLRVIRRSPTMWSAAGLLFLVYLAPGFQTPLLYHQQDVLRFAPTFMGQLQLIGGAGALLGAAVYAWLCRRVPLRTSLIAGILLNTGSTLFYLGYDSPAAAVAITFTAALLGSIALLPIYDLAARATPGGSESFGYALLLSVQSLAMFGVSDVVGSGLYDRLHVGFKSLVWINAASTAAVLLFVPWLPRALLAPRDGK
jgi:Na+/melibiose symporter-like transporter